jgi:hypothetical protein
MLPSTAMAFHVFLIAALLLLPLPAAFSKAVRTQSLLANPLSPDPITQEQQLSLAAPRTNASTLHFRLAHREHFALNVAIRRPPPCTPANRERLRERGEERERLRG